MKKIHPLNNQQGFTLIEIIAVLVLLGILAAVAVPKYLDLTTQAKNRAVDAGIAELNARESLNWGNLKLTPAGWVSDAATFALVDTTAGSLGDKYSWTAAPTVTGGELKFDGEGVTLDRTASTNLAPGSWKRH